MTQQSILKFPPLRKELGIILSIKIIILIVIKLLWFSDPVQNVEQAITHQFLPSYQIKQEPLHAK